MPGGALEEAALRELWALKSATAREVHERIGVKDGLAYTTTAKVLDRLHAKGLVARERVGQAFVYRPTRSREVVQRAWVRRGLTRILGPEPAPAIARLVDAIEDIDPKLLAELERVVKTRRGVRGGP